MSSMPGSHSPTDAHDVFFELSDDLLVTGGFDGYFRRVNPAWTVALGWSAAELCERPWLDFVHPDDLAATVAAGEALAAGAILTSFSNRYRCRDGAYRRLEWQCVPSVSLGLIYGVVRVEPASPEVGAAPQARTRVLIVDDEPGVARAMGRVLRDHDVTVVRYGTVALALLAGGRTFDVILADLDSPRMSGMELHAELARRFPSASARLAFVTGGAFTPEAIQFLEQVTNPRLGKPFRPDELRALVAEVAPG